MAQHRNIVLRVRSAEEGKVGNLLGYMQQIWPDLLGLDVDLENQSHQVYDILIPLEGMQIDFRDTLLTDAMVLERIPQFLRELLNFTGAFELWNQLSEVHLLITPSGKVYKLTLDGVEPIE